MSCLIFALPGNDKLAKNLSKSMDANLGEFDIHRFPDGETLVAVKSEVKNKKVVLVCTLFHPDEQVITLFFLAETLKSQGAKEVILVAPYLAYMRQDKAFHKGEGITSAYFAKFISLFSDHIITVDPHLHRYKSLSQIYSINSTVLHAAPLIAKWIKEHVENPVIIGPDSESKQWVAEVAKIAGAPFTVLTKKRSGDKEVEISIPEVDKYSNNTPVLVDDIISTARTMIETVKHLNSAGLKPTVCIGVHAVFAGNAYDELTDVGVAKIITCDSIPHKTNDISINGLIAGKLLELI